MSSFRHAKYDSTPEQNAIDNPNDTQQSAGMFVAPVVVTANRVFTAADDGKTFRVGGAFTLTVPEGLNWVNGVYVQCPVGGTVSIAVSGAATINDDIVTLTRTRTDNFAGFVIVPTAVNNVYGVSGA